MDKVYVPIYNNGEFYEDNCTYPESVCFKKYSDCVKWIKEQEEDGIHYQHNDNFHCWELSIDDGRCEEYDILYPNGFYTIHDMIVEEC